MDIDAASALLRDARRELNETRVRVAHLEQVVDGLTGILNAAGVDVGVRPGRRETLPGLEGSREAVSNMRPREAVLHVLQRRPGYNWTPRRVYDYLEQHGMVNTGVKSGIAAYDMALRRLAEEEGSGVERNDERGTYTYRRGVTSVNAARNRVVHAANGARYELSNADESELGARDADTLDTSLLEQIARRLVIDEEGARPRQLTPSEVSRLEEQQKVERGRRELEEKYGVVTRPSTSARKREDDV